MASSIDPAIAKRWTVVARVCEMRCTRPTACDIKFKVCKGSQQGGTIKGTISAATLNRFLALGSVVVGAH